MDNSFKTPKGTELPLMNLKGKPYLQVQHRLVWFREQFPLGRIETEAVSIDANGAIFKAKIFVPTESGEVLVATGTKQEHQKHFADFVEKAETGAIGRALLMAGFGTAFASEELDESDRLADAPMSIPTKKTFVSFKKPQTGATNDGF